MISPRKMVDFDNFKKIAWECGRFGQINCCQKVARSPINRPIWSTGSVTKLGDISPLWQNLKGDWPFLTV